MDRLIGKKKDRYFFGSLQQGEPYRYVSYIFTMFGYACWVNFICAVISFLIPGMETFRFEYEQ